MKRMLFVVSILALTACAKSADQAAPLYVAGDSIGVGIAAAAGLPSVAVVGAPLQSATTAAQLDKVPEGSTVILSLGTNDAKGGTVAVPRSLKVYQAKAAEHDLTLVWVGPPCIRQPWDAQAKKLADWIAAHVEFFVDLRDTAFCSSKVRASDGVHFLPAGYGLLWEKIKGRVG